MTQTERIVPAIMFVIREFSEKNDGEKPTYNDILECLYWGETFHALKFADRMNTTAPQSILGIKFDFSKDPPDSECVMEAWNDGAIIKKAMLDITEGSLYVFSADELGALRKGVETITCQKNNRNERKSA